MKIYTRSGDEGQTGLWGGERVSKADPRVWAYGNVDELNASLGMARVHGQDSDLLPLLTLFQSQLFTLGAELASPPERREKLGIELLSQADIHALEAEIDRYDAELAPLTHFILPGGSLLATWLHASRTICRRVEREIVALHEARPGHIRPEVLQYLNRLGDLLFVLARWANLRAGVPDLPWIPQRKTP